MTTTPKLLSVERNFALKQGHNVPIAVWVDEEKLTIRTTDHDIHIPKELAQTFARELLHLIEGQW